MEHLAQRLKLKYPQLQHTVKTIKSPLRFCPFGAHVDHQAGMVAGMTLDISVDMVYVQNEEEYIKVQSLDFPDEEYFHLEQVPAMVPGFWGNYLRGAVMALRKNYILKHGIYALVRGKHPIGGLSSSAAVTTAYLLALCDVNGIKLPQLELINYSHWVENHFIGLNNGILDQSINILSREGYLTVMDTKTKSYELIERPQAMPEFEVVIVYSGVSKALIGTDYNNRVDECKVAAWLLHEMAGLPMKNLKGTQLRDIEYEVYQAHKSGLQGRFQKRAEHFFTENERVKQGAEAWKRGDLQKFGSLMLESGESSIHNYECGCPELISIFQILKQTPGVYGARFSGAGYRGCCIGLVDPAYKEQIKAAIDAQYPKQHPAYKDLYQVCFSKTDDGARII
ncbi:hypothetical protein [Paenibacillus sp. KS-LC4]|uniref:GHMP family kinase ATP-binding protein n=1 Tax=Paenibacillus sp. KS-LC4 TaxID=2979727 RepID=UPI0030CB1E6B